jgi:OTU domain-containing protein 6
MGRRGMKGFIKSAMRKPGAGDEDGGEDGSAAGSDHEQPPPSKAEPAPASPKKSPSAAAAPPPPAADDSDNDGERHAGGGAETRGHMVQRHKREVVALKRSAPRGKGKAEAAKALADLEARHAKELADFDKAAAAAGGGGGGGGGAAAGSAAVASAASPGDRASKYLAGVSLGDDNDPSAASASKGGHHPTKAQKRREKLAAKEAERDARIAAELAALGPTERAKEAAALRALLAPMGLAVKSIRADGHCLYHSVADQLEQQREQQQEQDEDGGDAGGAPSSPLPDYLGLRRLAAEHMRQHRADFEPFLAEGAAGNVPRGWGEGGDGGGDGDGDQKEEGGQEEGAEEDKDAYARYVDAVERTAAWGGHVELTALAAALKRRIRVVAVGMPEVTAGDEFGGGGEGEGGEGEGEGAGKGKGPLTVCYVRHEFGLGEHYNSVRPRREGEEEEEEEDGAAAAQEEEQQEEDDDEA